VMRCRRNGPGGSKVDGSGLTGATTNNLAYVEGVPDHKINNDNLVDELEAMVRKRVAEKMAACENLIASGLFDFFSESKLWQNYKRSGG